MLSFLKMIRFSEPVTVDGHRVDALEVGDRVQCSFAVRACRHLSLLAGHGFKGVEHDLLEELAESKPFELCQGLEDLDHAPFHSDPDLDPVDRPPPTVTCRDHGTNVPWDVVGRREPPVEPNGLAAHSRFDDIEAQFHAALDAGLNPRGPDSLFAVVEGLGLPSGSSVVDIGCGRGLQALELSRRFGFNVIGIDPVYRQHDADLEAGSLKRGRVEFREGRAEAVPVPDATVDLIFCRESLMYADLGAAVSEFRRVLRAGGRGLVYLVLTGPRMTDVEAADLWAPLAPNSLRPQDIEQALARARFVIDERIDYGSEWGEVAQERDGTPGQRLLYAARLLREPSRYINQFGKTNYDIMLGDCFWHIYRMIGKLTGYGCAFSKL